MPGDPGTVAAAEDHPDLRAAVAKPCAGFPGEHWRRLDRARAYPAELVEALQGAGFLACLVPEDYGGSGLGLGAAAAIAFAALNEVEDLSHHPQLRRLAVATPSGEIRLPAPPARPVADGRRVPTLGADTERIRREFAA